MMRESKKVDPTYPFKAVRGRFIKIERLDWTASQSSLKYNVPLDLQLVIVLDKLLQSSIVKG